MQKATSLSTYFLHFRQEKYDATTLKIAPISFTIVLKITRVCDGDMRAIIAL